MIRAGAALVALSALLGGAASATEIDPTLFHRFTVAPPRLASRATSTVLPRELALAWRVRVAGGILHAPVVADDGRVLVVHALPTMAAYDGRGRLLWTARLGAAPAAHSPIVLGDGSLLVLTESADAVWFSARGRVLRRAALPLGSLDRPPALAGLANGSVIVAEGRRLVRIDGAGAVAVAKRLDEDIVALLGDPGEPLIVTAAGNVLSLSDDGRLSRRGGLGGRVDALARLDARRVVAVVDGRRLAELDLERESLTLSFSDPNVELSSTLAGQRGDLRVLASNDWLLAFRAERELFRVALPGAGATTPRSSSAELLLDPLGRALVVRSGIDAQLVAPDGTFARVEGTACPEPLRPQALPKGGVVLACRSGVISRLDGRAPPPVSDRPR